MRKMMLILSLAGLAGLICAGDAFAQRRGYGNGWGNSPGISIGFGRGGIYSSNGYYGGRGYSPYYQSYGNAYQIAPSYYYATPSYYSAPQVRDSYYTVPVAVQQSAHVTVLLPAADAEVWFQNRATTQQGMQRSFESPPLEPNQTFTYTVKARWIDGGQTVNRERQVNVQAGQSITVSFRENAREIVPLPRN